MKYRVDLRDVSAADIPDVIMSYPESYGFTITAWQWSRIGRKLSAAGLKEERFHVFVPDFLNYARLASTGQARQILELPGSISNLLKSGISCTATGIQVLPGLARGKFWAAAEALLAYDLGLLGGKFKGEVILHYNLTDFVWLFENEAFLDHYRKLASRRKWGLATQQISKGLSACARWQLQPDYFVYPVGIERSERSLVQSACTHSFPDSYRTLDITRLPWDVIQDQSVFSSQKNEELLISHSMGLRISGNY